jgi:WhiB family redox-sensing transcriptional regulator
VTTTDDYPLPIATTWRDHAACKGHDTAIFYPDVGQTADAARRICNTCPVALECNTEATLVGELGVWGGQTDTERNGGRRSHHPAYRAPTAKERLAAVLSDR